MYNIRIDNSYVARLRSDRIDQRTLDMIASQELHSSSIDRVQGLDVAFPEATMIITAPEMGTP